MSVSAKKAKIAGFYLSSLFLAEPVIIGSRLDDLSSF